MIVIRSPRELIETLIPEPAIRLAVLHQLVLSSRTADEVAPTAWAVSLSPHGFRLNVGQVEAMAYLHGGLRLLLAASSDDMRLNGLSIQTTNYRSVRGPQSAFVGTVEEFIAARAILDPLHEQFVVAAASTKSGRPRRGSAFARHHSAELMDYARTALEPSLGKPEGGPASAIMTTAHDRALDWFREQHGKRISWPSPLPDGTFLVNKAKGIHKPRGWKYALSVRQVLEGPYSDRDPERASDGSWSYRYYQEGQRPEDRDRYFTNKALLANLADGVPVGVLRQASLKPNPQYEVLGLATVVDWKDGYFLLVSEKAARENIPAAATPLTRSATVGPTRGPTPSSWSGTVSRDATAPASTYVFRFGKRNVWKIGHAQDVTSRLAEVNAHVPHEVLEERWTVVWQHGWPTQAAAFEMEQRALKLLQAQRTHGERVRCTEGELREAWTGAAPPTPK
jgi:hypothetical protein